MDVKQQARCFTYYRRNLAGSPILPDDCTAYCPTKATDKNLEARGHFAQTCAKCTGTYFGSAEDGSCCPNRGGPVGVPLDAVFDARERVCL